MILSNGRYSEIRPQWMLFKEKSLWGSGLCGDWFICHMNSISHNVCLDKSAVK